MVGKTKSKTKKVSPWRKIITIAICIAIPLCLGFTSAGLTGNAMSKFGQFNQPPLAPPAWLFPVAWTALYILMGLASYFIFIYKPKTKKDARIRVAALVLYCIQLVFNFAWSPIFFGVGAYAFALVWLVVMLFMVIAVVFLTHERVTPAMWCLIPYVLWCMFATYLNIGVMLLN